MEISSLRQEFSNRLLDFAWGQWAQMGLLAPSSRHDEWVADPEALLLLSFELGRDEPRLFDEVLDWLLVNARLISTQRLRNLSRDGEDQALSGAAIGWLSQQRRKMARPAAIDHGAAKGAEPLFLESGGRPKRPDPAFLEHGLLKAWTEPRRRSGHPSLHAPINFALRLRSLLGVGARAEVARVLLCVEAPRMSLQAIAASSGYAKRNVQEAAGSLRDAGVASSTMLGNELRFEMARDPWLALLDLERMPRHVDWPQLFHAYRILLRWLRDPTNEELSGYMLASEARAVLERVAPDLQLAGTRISVAEPSGEEFMSYFVSVLQGLPPAV
jgi:hypothetical protein